MSVLAVGGAGHPQQHIARGVFWNHCVSHIYVNELVMLHIAAYKDKSVSSYAVTNAVEYYKRF